MTTLHRTPQRGFSLIEAVIAIVVAALGILGIIKFQGQLFQSGSIAKQRTIATTLAQERVEELRAFVSAAGYDTLAAVDGTPNDATPGNYGSDTISRDGASFTRQTQIATHTQPYRFLEMSVTVSWTTASASTETVVLRSAVAWADPSSAGVLLHNASIIASQDCSTQTVNDSVCSGTANTATNGSSVNVTYSAGGAGSGVFVCTNGVFVKQSGTCTANCLSGQVTDGTCTGAVPATNTGSNVNVTYTAGGTGSGVWACSNGAWSKSSGTCDPLSCNLPWGGTLASGDSVFAYSNSAPTTSCAAAQQTRTCNNGVLSGTYTNQSCNEPCIAGGQIGTIASGATVTAYQASSAPSCASETRTCTNGVLSGTYAYTSCTPTALSCNVYRNDGTTLLTTIAAGGTYNFYNTASAATCPATKTYTCDGATGTFKSGAATNTSEGYVYSSCSQPCSYRVEIQPNSSSLKFCSTATTTLGNNLVSNSGTALASTCSLNASNKLFTCTGTYPVGSTATISTSAITATKKENCSTAWASATCSTTSIVCSTAGTVTSTVSCTASP